MEVILGTGAVGRAVMKELLSQGKTVRMVNTSGKADVPNGVEVVKADLYDKNQVREVVTGAGTVFHCVAPAYHKWSELFLPLQQSILNGVSGSGAKLVFADNLYMYGPVNGLIHEDLPYKAGTKKGEVRKRMAEQLFEAHAKGKVKAVAVRGSDYYGPYGEGSSIGAQFFGPIAQGKPCTLYVSADMPHTYTFLGDFGKAIVMVSEQDDAFGQAWHVPSSETVTPRQFADLAYQEAGYKDHPPVKVMGKGLLRLGGLFIPAARELVEMLYQVQKPFIVDSSKFTERFGFSGTPLREALKETVEWYRGK